MLEVEVTSGQSWNFIFFCESSQSSHSLIEILLLHKIIKYSRRISQAIKRLKLRNTMLKRLNLMLQKKAISWVPDSAPPLSLFRTWIRASSGLISSISASVGGESHEANFFRFLAASKEAMPYWSEEETFWSFM
jgi:hypothetical protein